MHNSVIGEIKTKEPALEPEPIEEIQPIEEPVTNTYTGTTTEQTNINQNKSSIDKIIEEQKQLVKKEEIKQEDYQPMPDFEVWGRGLVYNCKGRHWACVNREAYFQCKKNENWNFVRDMKTECKTVNVYSTFKDCRTIQLYNINQAVTTDFCKSE